MTFHCEDKSGEMPIYSSDTTEYAVASFCVSLTCMRGTANRRMRWEVTGVSISGTLAGLDWGNASARVR
jgi:hypothetical protein